MAKKKTQAKYFDPLARRPEEKRAIRRGGHVSAKVVTRFSTQLATLQEAGLPIVRSLKILEGQLRPGRMKMIAGAVAEDVEGGASLSEAMAKHPAAFDNLYVQMVRAGEAGGMLDKVLRRVADFKEKAEKLRTQIKGAITYPIFVILFALGVIFFITTVVVPQFEKIFRDLGSDELPRATQLLLGLSNFLQKHWYVVLAIPVLVYLVFKMVRRSARGQLATDRWSLRLPRLGGINRKNKIARVGRTLGTLIASGVPLLDALEITRNGVGNRVIEQALDKVKSAVREGEGIAEPMGETRQFDDMVVNMVAVGEETGELDRMLLRVADTYEYEVDIEVAGLVRLLEPLLIILVGGIVGFILFAVFLPLLEIIKKLGASG
ncbi:MAG: type II secretion system F family protein [Planctomycetes bacterium]|nr:type II secretion system F family protein [Planctomycetota bacterium]